MLFRSLEQPFFAGMPAEQAAFVAGCGRNVVVEVSMPTLLVFLFVDSTGSLSGILMPPPFLYFLFIVLSALRLDFKICVFTGLVAAIEYMLIYAYAARLPSSGSLSVLLYSPFHHAAKASALAICGPMSDPTTRPGASARSYICTTEMPVASAITISTRLGGMSCASVPAAVITPQDSACW